MVNRRHFLLAATGFTGTAAAYSCYWEPRWFELSTPAVRVPHLVAGTAIRILHLSDLHASSVVPLSLIDYAISLGLAAKPDLICLTGDFVTSRDGYDAPAYVGLLRRLGVAAPTYAVLGNHDGGLWAGGPGQSVEQHPVAAMLRASGITLLHNRAEEASVRGQRLQLVGVGDLWEREVQPQTAFQNVTEDLPTILLAHNPDTKDEVARQSWHVMLSGHTHGGQVVLPFGIPRYAPVRDKRYVAGLKPWGERWIHVTRGVGNIAGVRFRCRPEVALLSLEPGAGKTQLTIHGVNQV